MKQFLNGRVPAYVNGLCRCTSNVGVVARFGAQSLTFLEGYEIIFAYVELTPDVARCFLEDGVNCCWWVIELIEFVLSFEALASQVSVTGRDESRDPPHTTAAHAPGGRPQAGTAQ